MVKSDRYREMFPFSYVYSNQHKPSTTSRVRQANADLDDQIKMSLVVVQGGGGVRPNDRLAVDLGSDRDVLSDRKTQTVGRLW